MSKVNDRLTLSNEKIKSYLLMGFDLPSLAQLPVAWSSTVRNYGPCTKDLGLFASGQVWTLENDGNRRECRT